MAASCVASARRWRLSSVSPADHGTQCVWLGGAVTRSVPRITAGLSTASATIRMLRWFIVISLDRVHLTTWRYGRQSVFRRAGIRAPGGRFFRLGELLACSIALLTFTLGARTRWRFWVRLSLCYLQGCRHFPGATFAMLVSWPARADAAGVRGRTLVLLGLECAMRGCARVQLAAGGAFCLQPICLLQATTSKQRTPMVL
jgi:hypothetical protein